MIMFQILSKSKNKNIYFLSSGTNLFSVLVFLSLYAVLRFKSQAMFHSYSPSSPPRPAPPL